MTGAALELLGRSVKSRVILLDNTVVARNVHVHGNFFMNTSLQQQHSPSESIDGMPETGQTYTEQDEWLLGTVTRAFGWCTTTDVTHQLCKYIHLAAEDKGNVFNYETTRLLGTYFTYDTLALAVILLAEDYLNNVTTWDIMRLVEFQQSICESVELIEPTEYTAVREEYNGYYLLSKTIGPHIPLTPWCADHTNGNLWGGFKQSRYVVDHRHQIYKVFEPLPSGDYRLPMDRSVTFYSHLANMSAMENNWSLYESQESDDSVVDDYTDGTKLHYLSRPIVTMAAFHKLYLHLERAFLSGYRNVQVYTFAGITIYHNPSPIHFTSPGFKLSGGGNNSENPPARKVPSKKGHYSKALKRDSQRKERPSIDMTYAKVSKGSAEIPGEVAVIELLSAFFTRIGTTDQDEIIAYTQLDHYHSEYLNSLLKLAYDDKLPIPENFYRDTQLFKDYPVHTSHVLKLHPVTKRWYAYLDKEAERVKKEWNQRLVKDDKEMGPLAIGEDGYYVRSNKITEQQDPIYDEQLKIKEIASHNVYRNPRTLVTVGEENDVICDFKGQFVELHTFFITFPAQMLLFLLSRIFMAPIWNSSVLTWQLKCLIWLGQTGIFATLCNHDLVLATCLYLIRYALSFKWFSNFQYYFDEDYKLIDVNVNSIFDLPAYYFGKYIRCQELITIRLRRTESKIGNSHTLKEVNNTPPLTAWIFSVNIVEYKTRCFGFQTPELTIPPFEVNLADTCFCLSTYNWVSTNFDPTVVASALGRRFGSNSLMSGDPYVTSSLEYADGNKILGTYLVFRSKMRMEYTYQHQLGRFLPNRGG